MSDGFFLKALFDIFKCQIPIELHENALYACLNILQDSSKDLKLQLYQLNIVSPLLKFVQDLFETDNEIIMNTEQKNGVVVFVDYKLEWNPDFRNNKVSRRDELTIAEMQQQRLHHQFYIWKANEEGLFKDLDNDGQNFKRVHGRESLRKSTLLKHIQELRAIGYSLINLLQIQNAKLLQDLMSKKYQSLAVHLK